MRARVLAVDAEARRLSLGLKASDLDGADADGEAGAAEEGGRPGGADLDAEAAEAGGARPSVCRAVRARPEWVPCGHACKRACASGPGDCFRRASLSVQALHAVQKCAPVRHACRAWPARHL